MKEISLWNYNASVFEVTLKGFMIHLPLLKKNVEQASGLVAAEINNNFPLSKYYHWHAAYSHSQLHPAKFIWLYALMFWFSDWELEIEFVLGGL